MKILILGGNRFFGKKLAARLLDEGRGITLLNRQTRDDGFGDRITRIKCDRTNAHDLKNQITENYDIVYDQICYEPRDARTAVEIFAGRTPHYVFTSSQSVYHAGANLAESAFDPATYEFETDATDYAEAKRQCESVFFHQSKLKVTAIRFPIVCGPDDYTGRLRWHVDHIRERKPMHVPNLEARLSLILSDDAASILSSLKNHPAQGPLNVCADEPILLRQLISTIEEKAKTKAVIEPTGDPSPYGIDSDWFMNTKKLNSLGLSAKPIMSWLANLV